jgi:septum formation protein
VDESLGTDDPELAAVTLARRKARAVAAERSAGVVLGADTIVVLDGVVLGKPPDAADARRMLRALRGRWHEVVTGLAAIDVATGRERSTAVVSRVCMADYGDDVIEAYVAIGEPFDKAGGYAIQEGGGRLVTGLVGSYTNVVGLPLEALRRLLDDLGVLVSAAGGPR